MPALVSLPDLLSPEQCAAVLDYARDLEPLNGTPAASPSFLPLPPDLEQLAPVQQALEQVNADHWNLPRGGWHCTVARYRPGTRFLEHQDFDPRYGPDAYGITYAASVLLADPEDFTGGALTVEGQPMPKAQGSGHAFHAFTWHRVEPITAGERYALNVFATLGTIGDALELGWPARWLFASDAPS